MLALRLIRKIGRRSADPQYGTLPEGRKTTIDNINLPTLFPTITGCKWLQVFYMEQLPIWPQQPSNGVAWYLPRLVWVFWVLTTRNHCQRIWNVNRDPKLNVLPKPEESCYGMETIHHPSKDWPRPALNLGDYPVRLLLFNFKMTMIDSDIANYFNRFLLFNLKITHSCYPRRHLRLTVRSITYTTNYRVNFI